MKKLGYGRHSKKNISDEFLENEHDVDYTLKLIELELDDLGENNFIRKIFNCIYTIFSIVLLALIVTNPIANILGCGITFVVMTIFNYVIKKIYGTKRMITDRVSFLVARRNMIQFNIFDENNIIDNKKEKNSRFNYNLDFSYKFDGYKNNSFDNNMENETDKIKRLIKDRNSGV